MSKLTKNINTGPERVAGPGNLSRVKSYTVSKDELYQSAMKEHGKHSVEAIMAHPALRDHFEATILEDVRNTFSYIPSGGFYDEMRLGFRLGIRYQNETGPSKIYGAVSFRNFCNVKNEGGIHPYPDTVLERLARDLLKYTDQSDPDSAKFIEEVGIANHRRPTARKVSSFVVAALSGGGKVYNLTRK